MNITSTPIRQLLSVAHIKPLLKACLVAASMGIFLSGCGTTAPSSAGPARASDDVLKLQIFLDSQNFGPGAVDGHAGEFTDKALALYRSASGLPTDAMPDTDAITPYATYTVTAQDLSVLGTMAEEPAEVAAQSKLPYTQLAELVAERFHTTPRYLAEINPGTSIGAVQPGETLTVPNVRRAFRFDRFPSEYPAPSASTAGNRRVTVDIDQRMLQVLQGNSLIAAFPITPGSSEHPAPKGEWKVAGSVPWPWYRYDEGVLKRGERTETFYNFPPGPNSPVGVLWAGLNRPGVGIHGTSSPDSIGRSGSHGCIRLSNWDASIFYTLVAKGTPVTIH